MSKSWWYFSPMFISTHLKDLFKAKVLIHWQGGGAMFLKWDEWMRIQWNYHIQFNWDQISFHAGNSICQSVFLLVRKNLYISYEYGNSCCNFSNFLHCIVAQFKTQHHSIIAWGSIQSHETSLMTKVQCVVIIVQRV